MTITPDLIVALVCSFVLGLIGRELIKLPKLIYARAYQHFGRRILIDLFKQDGLGIKKTG